MNFLMIKKLYKSRKKQWLSNYSSKIIFINNNWNIQCEYWNLLKIYDEDRIKEKMVRWKFENILI